MRIYKWYISIVVSWWSESIFLSVSLQLNHNESHAARYYTVPRDVAKQLFVNGTLPYLYEKQVKTFQETCIMVRSPALEIMDYLRAADYSGPAIRYVLCILSAFILSKGRVF